MKIRLVIPAVKLAPETRPEVCPHCGHWRLHRHGTVIKPLKDHRRREVVVQRYKCGRCARTFRHYPEGVGRATQSQRTIALAALLYAFGLSCSTSAHVLGALDVDVCAMTVWRDAQALGEVLRRTRPGGRVRVLGADETVYRVKGQETVVGFVTDDQTGTTLDFEVLGASDGETFRQWLEPLVEQYGVEVLVSDEHRSYGVVVAELGIEQQLCLAHVRKAVTKRGKAILAQARQEGVAEQHLQQLETEFARIRELVRSLPADGGRELEALHRRYLDADPPGTDEQASVAYRMRLLTLELWDHWGKLRLHLRRPELGLDGTNNGTERAIGKSKVRYKTMRGYKSLAGLINGIALTQWLYSGAEQHDLAAVLAA